MYSGPRRQPRMLVLMAAAGRSDAALSLNLTQALSDTKAKLAAGQQADILIFGDSLSFSTDESTYLTYFRDYLQSTYGNAGFGYQGAACGPVPGSTVTGPARSSAPIPSRTDRSMDYGRVTSRCWGGRTRLISIQNRTTLSFSTWFSPAAAHLKFAAASTGEFVQVTTINTNSASNDVLGYPYQLLPGETAFTIQPVGDGPFTILGQNTSTNTPGVRAASGSKRRLGAGYLPSAQLDLRQATGFDESRPGHGLARTERL